MKIFTPVWGEKFLSYMERGLIPSLSTPSNRAAVEGCDWIIVSTKEDAEKASLLVKNPVIKIVPEHNVGDTVGFISHGLQQAIKICLDANEALLIAMPDYVFFEGTIETLRRFEGQPGVCVGFAHPRVVPEFLDCTGDEWESRDELWFEFRHHSFETSEYNSATQKNASFIGGISWTKLNETTLMVQHRLPSTVLANFLPEDLKYFQSQPFSAWDHTWPAEWKGERARFIGCSDAAFAVEITDPDSHLGAMEAFDPKEPDKYQRDLEHHKRNRQFVSIWRV